MLLSTFFRRPLWTFPGTTPPRRRTNQLSLQPLEDRRVPTIAVTSLLDNGDNINPTPGSLREAIITANNGFLGDKIEFAVQNGMITLAAALPDLTHEKISIIVFSDQHIILDGVNTGNAAGLTLAGDFDFVTGLSIVRFGGPGIRVKGFADTVDGNYIGTDYEGNPGLGNGDGVRIDSSAAAPSFGNQIINNYIAGNNGNGVALNGAGTTGNELANNFIGLAVRPKVDSVKKVLFPLPNQLDGVAITGGASDNQVGGNGLFLNGDTTNGHGNIIVASGGNGVRLSGIGTTMNRVQGNLIGTDQSGTATVLDAESTANKNNGVMIAQGAANNLIGGYGGTKTKTGQGNLISGNLGAGVDIRGDATNNNDIQGNRIGTDLTGASALGNSYGVYIETGASDNTLGGAAPGEAKGRGNLISGNTAAGVTIDGTGATGNLVQANTIGTNFAGTLALGNGGDGVVIFNGASDNTVGGVNNSMFLYMPGNLIAGNLSNGIFVGGPGTTDNRVEGNKIGTNLAGTKSVLNIGNGVVVTQGATGNVIGGDTADAGNLISGNGGSGVVINATANANVVQNNTIGTTAAGLATLGNGNDGVDLMSNGNIVVDNLVSGNRAAGLVLGGSQNTIQRNKIGTNVKGTAAVANLHDGILINITTGTGGNAIGGSAASAGNLISGNGWNGIDITGPASAANRIEGNTVGTDVAGKKAVANQRDGILVDNSTGFTIGGALLPTGNLISGNKKDGVEITGGASIGLIVLGNRIGTDYFGQVALPNLGNGVRIDKGAKNNVIGGTAHLAGNLISGNALDGVLIDFYATNFNTVLGNRIGTDISGTTALANHGHGVQILNAFINTIGGTADGAGNLISGNTHDGVQLGLNASKNLVVGNWIGTDRTGTKAMPNGSNGVELLDGANDNTIGSIPTTTGMPSNVISGNKASGVAISGLSTKHNLVEGNYIGTTRSGAAGLANKGHGVSILHAAENQIGGVGGVGTGGAGNLIARNLGDGVKIFGTGSDLNVVQGNSIGTDVTGQLALGNAGHGVFVAQGAQNNSIGGAASGTGNVIAYNTHAGVAVGASKMDVNTLHNSILSNSIFSNLGRGIDLGDNNVTVNVPGGPHVGPNAFQNTPVITDAIAGGAQTLVRLTLDGIPSSVFTIQIFANTSQDPTGYGQGKTLVATVTVSTDPSGNTIAPVLVTIPQNLAGMYLTATATAPLGDTSEFAKDMKVVTQV